MELPTRSRTRYAKSGDVNIAYQVVGEGHCDLVWVPGLFSHLEGAWTDPDLARMFIRLAALGRLIMFDKRGTGMSDRLPAGDLPPFAERMDDIRAVMDAAGSQRATLVAWSEGAALAALFAATFPQRVERLVLYGGFPRLLRGEGFSGGLPEEQVRVNLRRVVEKWAEPDDIHKLWAPSKSADAEFWERFAQVQALAATPAAAEALVAMTTDVDVRDVLPMVQAPTLVLHRSGDLIVPLAASRYFAEHISNATLVELSGSDHVWWVGDQQAILDEIEQFLTGAPPAREADRVLATVLFSDIVDSTEVAARLGDRRWRELLERHDRIFRQQLERHNGREVKTTGDGFLATFDAPARAIRCAQAAAGALRGEGVIIRAGVHTGECELRGDDIAGIAVHIAARLAVLAQPHEILVSRTVTDLVTGSGLTFEERGAHQLKGVPGEWQLFAVAK